MPHRLQGGFAQEGTPKGNLHPVPSVYVVPQMVETGMVHKDIVHAVYVAMEVTDLHRYDCQQLISLIAMHGVCMCHPGGNPFCQAEG